MTTDNSNDPVSLMDVFPRGTRTEVGVEGPMLPPRLDLLGRWKGFAKARELLARQPEAERDLYRFILESICGTTDDSQPVEQYDGTLGVPLSFVQRHERPVGQLQWNTGLGAIYTNPGNVAGVRWCTGTLISEDLFLTAGHCFDEQNGGWISPRINGTNNSIPPAEIAQNMRVNFNYQVDADGILRTEESFAIRSLNEYRLGSLDFAIVRLQGQPGLRWGIATVSSIDAVVGEDLCIIGHPAGQPKRIEAGPATTLSGTDLRYNDIDTLGGNSGSGVLLERTGQIVGVHTNGGCTSTGGSNRALRISSAIAQSPILKGLTSDAGNKQQWLESVLHAMMS